ncbi:MAG: hypothetical protein EBT63_00090 [Proteobacteria bacterium]|nr:hypothetical protein [Pseudomonadota bacterium]NCA27661.1 hypothetical protein [Pseudomonadota bacterium]
MVGLANRLIFVTIISDAFGIFDLFAECEIGLIILLFRLIHFLNKTAPSLFFGLESCFFRSFLLIFLKFFGKTMHQTFSKTYDKTETQ